MIRYYNLFLQKPQQCGWSSHSHHPHKQKECNVWLCIKNKTKIVVIQIFGSPSLLRTETVSFSCVKTMELKGKKPNLQELNRKCYVYAGICNVIHIPDQQVQDNFFNKDIYTHTILSRCILFTHIHTWSRAKSKKAWNNIKLWEIINTSVELSRTQVPISTTHTHIPQKELNSSSKHANNLVIEILEENIAFSTRFHRWTQARVK